MLRLVMSITPQTWKSITGESVSETVAAPASHEEAPREVFIGCAEMKVFKEFFGPLASPVADAVSGWGGIGEPNLSFHWAVIVGDGVHELSADGILPRNKYVNGQVERVENSLQWGRYHVYPVGTTRLSDAAIATHGRAVIDNMPWLYHPVTNNCQIFVVGLLRLICDPGYKQVKTVFDKTDILQLATVALAPSDSENATDEQIAHFQAKEQTEQQRRAEIAGKVADEHAEQAEEQANLQFILRTAEQLMKHSEEAKQVPGPVVVVPTASSA